MSVCSSREAASKLGISLRTLERYIAGMMIPCPKISRLGGVRFRLWSDEDIEKVEKLLPTIKKVRTRKRSRSA